MADFYGALSSTSFRVRDNGLFIADPSIVRIQNWAEEREGFFEQKGDYWAFGWYDQYPSMTITVCVGECEDNEGVDIFIPSALQQHIFPGDVCKIGVSGNEKLRYIGGVIYWVTARGYTAYNAETCWESKDTESNLEVEFVATQRGVRSLLRLSANERNGGPPKRRRRALPGAIENSRIIRMPGEPIKPILRKED